MKKALIFDLDGVLVHTDRYHFLAWKQIAGEIGAAFDEKVNDRLRGVSRRESLEIILEGCEEKQQRNKKNVFWKRKTAFIANCWNN